MRIIACLLFNIPYHWSANNILFINRLIKFYCVSSMVFHGRNVAIYSIISVCSCLACMWLFYRFLKQMKKCIGSWLVVILGISDFFYSANVLLEEHFHEIKIGQIYIFAYIHNFSICFSILWASAISFIVYKSLSDRYSNQKVRFASTLVAILAASFIFTLM